MKKFVDSYCNYLKKKGIIVSDEQLEICAYGLELIVSAILNIVILVMCSFVLHEERYILFYFLGFIPLRLFAGGYHADNHLNCCIIFAGIYVVSVFLRCIAEPPLVLCFIVVETLLILLLSPVESVNKQITSKRRRISRNRSIWILLANVVVCIVFLWVQPNNSYIEYYLISGFLASSTMIAGKIKLHFASRKKEGASYEKIYQLVYCAWWSDYYCTGNCCSNRFCGHYLSV